MSILSNIPSRSKTIQAFLDSDLVLKLRFPDAYSLSDLEAKLYYNGRFREGIATVSSSGSLATITITKENLQAIKLPQFTLIIYSGGVGIISALVELKFSGDGSVNDTINITISDGIDVQLSFNDTRENLEYTERAEEAASSAESSLSQVTALTNQNIALASQVDTDKTATEGYRDEVVNLKSDVTTLKSETNQIKTDTNTIKTDTIAIRDEAMAIVANPRPATYAAMVALLRLNHPKTFTVQNDEFQGIQKVPYYWDGVELYVYGTLVDPQPTVTQ